MRYLLSLIALLMFVPSLHAQVGPLPCGANSSLSTWRQDFGYSIGQVVLLNGVTYQSLVNNNINQNPCTYQGSMWSNVVGSGGGGGATVATYTTPGLAPQGIAYVYASQVTDSVTVDQLINAAGLTLPDHGGIIDARGLGAGTYHVTGQITALNNVSQAITLILNPQTQFIIDTQFSTLTNSPSSCAIPVGPSGTAPAGQFYGASAIIVPGANRLGFQQFFLGDNARVWDVVCSGSFSGTQESLMLDGVSIRGNPTAQMSGALLHLQGIYGPTLVSNSSTQECFGQCLEVDSANNSIGITSAGSIMFLNDIWSDYYTGQSVYPGSVVKLDTITSAGGLGAIAFVGGIIQGNGPHNPLLVLNGRGGSQLSAISFQNTYLETQLATTSIYNSNVDPVQFIDANQITWDVLKLGGNHGGNQTHVVDISSTGNSNVYSISFGSLVGPTTGYTSIIHNTVDGTDETGFNVDGAFLVPNYTFGGVGPSVRLTNVTPPGGACTSQTLGTLWSDSTSQTGALFICESIGSTPTWFNVSTASPSTIAGMSPDELNGIGLFATGASDFPTGFGATGCNAGNVCTFTRSTSTVPNSNYVYSEQVNITTNAIGNMNGIQTTANYAYVAGQTYVYSFWAKSDGSLVAYPTAILGNPSFASICFSEGSNLLTSTWTLYTFQCTPTTSGTTALQLGTETPTTSTGSFYLAGFQFTQITPLPPSGLISSVAPYGIGPASTAQQTITINSIACVLGSSCSVSSGGPGFTLTTTGTSGASTLIGTVLNIPTPSAGTFTSLTTTGTSGAATLTSGVLNIPTPPAAVVTSLTTTGTGAATLSGGVLNVPTPAAAAFTSLTTTGTTGAATLSSGVLNIPTPPTTAVNATSLAGGAVGSAPYQSAANTTTFITSPTTSGHTFVYGWSPAGSAIAPTAIDLATYLATPGAIGGTTASTGRFTTVTATGLSVAGIVTNTSGGLLGTAATVPIANGGTGAATAGAGTYFGNAGTSTAAPSFVSNSYDNLVAGAGAVPTTTGSSCGTLGTPVGGTYAGTVTSTGATTCTLKLTFPAAAAHGYICIFYDITTSGDYYGFGSVPTVTTTSCQNTSSAITSGDTMQYIARPY